MAEHDAQPRHEEPDPRRYIALSPSAPDGAIELAALWPELPNAQGHDDIEIEIGFGRGMFLFERAVAAPGSRLLGIEIKRKWAYLVEQRAKKLGHRHVRVFGGDARDILLRLSPSGSVARVFMHFPDPWWKARHEKRRLRGPEFFDTLTRLLRPGGELFVQTDVEERAEVFLADMRAHPELHVAVDNLADNPFGARSNREKRAIEDGLPVFRILATRR